MTPLTGDIVFGLGIIVLIGALLVALAWFANGDRS